MRTLAVPRSVVSQNHALLWRDEQGLHVRDLGSTNGTRLLVPRFETISLGTVHEPCVELALLQERLPEEPEPVDASSPESFHREIARAVSEWLSRAGLSADVSVVGRDDPAPPAQLDIPVGAGCSLRLKPTQTPGQTQHEGWSGAIRGVRRYVSRQLGAFREEQRCEHEDRLVLASPSMQRLHRGIVRAARLGMGGVLLGETGVGKTLLARCFHKHSGRRGQFVYTNLARQSPDVNFFTRHLYGAVRGAATDIKEDEAGAVQNADRGTLFLDEIGELPYAIQGALLDFLDTGEYSRFGEEGRRSVRRRSDVLLVVGTNIDLEQAVAKRSFREDLWYRLQALDVFHIPPLRERREDIEEHLRRAQKRVHDHELSLYDLFSADALDFVSRRFDWPGNFRQLDTFVRKIVRDDELETIGLPDCLHTLGVRSSPPPPSLPTGTAASLLGTPRALTSLTTAEWTDMIEQAERVFPRWRDARASVSPERSPPDLTIFLDEVLKPLVVARMLGVEGWRELPRTPPRSYSQMARDIDFADNKSVKQLLGAYFRLMRAVGSTP